MKYKLLAALMLLSGGLLFGMLKVSAQDGKTESVMTISPPQQKIILYPGETYESSIDISSPIDSEYDLKYSLSIGSYGLTKDENGKVDYNDTDVDTVTGYNQIMNWIKLGKTSGTVAPNETDTVPFTIVVPQDAPAGGQYATIIVQNDTSVDDKKGGNVSIKNEVRFAASILAEVAGETREEGEILENSIPAFMTSGPLAATSIVKNNGNVHTDAKYTLQVWPLFSDEEICTNDEKPSESMIMPETDRFHTEECNISGFGIFRAKQTVEIFGEKSEVEKIVVLCPLWLMFLIIFLIAALIIWIVMKVQARKKAQDK